MKKLFLMLSVAMLSFGTANVFAQENTEAAAPATEEVAAPAEEAVATEEAIDPEVQIEGETMHHVLMQKFLEGGWGWMLPILIVLVLGLAIAIERILFLAFSSINTKKFIAQVEAALKEGGVEAAKEVCRNTRGPIASIYWQGLDRANQGLDAVEKAVVSYGSVQTGQLESGLTWLSLFISLSPSLGFLGTVVGLVQSFDAIQAAGDISPALVAGGMKVALLTTLLGLISAMILQVFYNYVISKIDSIVNEMEDASISLLDMLNEK